MYAPFDFRFVAIPYLIDLMHKKSSLSCPQPASETRSSASRITVEVMTNPNRSTPTPIQILAGVTAAAAAWLLLPKPRRSPGVTVITGGSRGLGLALAHRFGEAGDRLVLCARDADELARAQQALLSAGSVQTPDHILLVPADLPADAQSLIDQTLSRFGRLDTLINNAGVIEVGPIENQPLEAFHRAMSTNFFAALHTIHAALPHLLSQPEINGRRASVINISSIGGKVPVPHLLPYVASKFALTGLSEGLHAELRLKGIRVTTVCPGLMRTGSSIQAEFTGQAEKEFQWFSLGSITPGLAASTSHAANRIYNATAAGCAEITITPQAWLAARIVGLAPAASQFLAAYANQYILPAPAANPSPLIPGAHLKKSGHSELEKAHNQA